MVGLTFIIHIFSNFMHFVLIIFHVKIIKILHVLENIWLFAKRSMIRHNYMLGRFGVGINAIYSKDHN